ncbi:hypothetical protein RRG08_011071 [Elysia crispata]|uniref:Uncharacterized protein n=1 Tax=Elysia crispata TaxID=231223 RepID=A0AAE1DBV4_9GAST|nr:hypothetical protein RRG08_011071 [Elysia crispata]
MNAEVHRMTSDSGVQGTSDGVEAWCEARSEDESVVVDKQLLVSCPGFLKLECFAQAYNYPGTSVMLTARGRSELPDDTCERNLTKGDWFV